MGIDKIRRYCVEMKGKETAAKIAVPIAMRGLISDDTEADSDEELRELAAVDEEELKRASLAVAMLLRFATQHSGEGKVTYEALQAAIDRARVSH